MRENGSTSRKKDMGHKNFQTVVIIRVSISMERQEELVHTVGPTDSATMGNGSTDSNMVRVCGGGKKGILIKGSGNSAIPKDTGCIHGRMGITMKDNSSSV
jgi:hypothetical protein